MASNTRGPRRSRKSRPAAAPGKRPAGGAAGPARGQGAADGGPGSGERGRAASRARARGRRRVPAYRDFDQRPQAPWHPLPLSELLILVGLIGAVVGIARGSSGRALLFTGLGAVVIGTLEFTVREHLSGYRPHTTLLAFLPTALFHSAVAVALVALGAPAPVWALLPLVLDVPVFVFLFRLLRIRFQDARRERILSGGG